MFKSSIKYRLKTLLAVDAEKPVSNLTDNQAKNFVTFSLKRSGQHAVINWLCSQIQDVAHFNHCNFERKNLCNWITPINNRIIQYNGSDKVDSGIQSYADMQSLLSEISYYKNLLYSFEDIDLYNKIIQKYIHKESPTVILILRDPYNWLASTIKRKDCNPEQLYAKKALLIKYLEQALNINDPLTSPIVAINYNNWVTDLDYRKQLCNTLSLSFSVSADSAILEVPDFGGGSSFEGTKPIENNFNSSVFNRWQEYASNSLYCELLDDPYLVNLAKSYFGIDKPF